MTESRGEKANSPKEASPEPDANLWLKWLGFLLPVGGLLLFAAGKAYLTGFWSVAGLGHLGASAAFQDIAYTGLVGPLRIWLWAPVAMLFYAVYFFSLVVTSRRSRPPPRWLLYWVKRAKRKWKLDDSPVFLILGKVSIMLFSTLILGFGPALILLINTQNAGQERFEQLVCTVRKTGGAATVKLGGGVDLKGMMLERSSSNVLLLQADKVLWISLGAAGKVEMESRLPDVGCHP